MNKFYVVDYFSKKYYGPFKNCKKSKQAARLVRDNVVSDTFLENTTNIMVIEDFNLIPSDFQYEDIKKIKQTYQHLFGEESNAIY